MNLSRSLGLVVVLTTLAASDVVAQTEPQPLAATQCTSGSYRQFDFWIGEWDVTQGDGSAAGSNRIVAIEGGCALQEFWRGADGGTGTSLNAYDFTRGQWHQTWVSGSSVIMLAGKFENGRMIMYGETVDGSGATTHNRITWTPVDANTVMQLWEQSADRVEWRSAFNGKYTRRR